MVRKTRRGFLPSASAAACTSGTRIQRSPATSFQAGRSTARLGDPGGFRSGDRICRNDGGEGMGGIDHSAGPVTAEIVRKTARTAESADPGIERRGLGRPRRAGERQRAFETLVPGDQPSERGGLGRSAEQEDFQS